MTSSPAILVIGASGGIGSALSRQLAKHNYRLMLAARDADRLDALASELQAPSLTLDARDFDQVNRAFEQTIAQLGPLHGVVNLAGSVLLKPAHRTSAQEYADCIATNLTTAFATVHAAGKHMSRQGGSVVLLSSSAATVGLANHEAVAAAKAGIIGLARSAAATYAAKGLRFNAVAPGLVRTPLTAHITEKPQSLSYSLAMHALDRAGEPEDIASMIAWLLDPLNSWVTGQAFHVDGGLGHIKAPR